MVRKELEKRIHGLDLDSPELELLDDVEIINLLNGYFRVFMPEVSSVDRATWCGGFMKGLPAFIALRDQYKDRDDVVFLTISDDGIEAKSRWLDFLKEKKYSGKVPHLIINKEKDQFVKDYCITGIPRYILIDREGKIVNAWHVAISHEFFPWMFSMEQDHINRD